MEEERQAYFARTREAREVGSSMSPYELPSEWKTTALRRGLRNSKQMSLRFYPDNSERAACGTPCAGFASSSSEALSDVFTDSLYGRAATLNEANKDERQTKMRTHVGHCSDRLPHTCYVAISAWSGTWVAELRGMCRLHAKNGTAEYLRLHSVERQSGIRPKDKLRPVARGIGFHGSSQAAN